mgnify:CR=1 FL=1
MESVAESVTLTVDELVYEAPLLMLIEPFGGVVSEGVGVGVADGVGVGVVAVMLPRFKLLTCTGVLLFVVVPSPNWV